MIERYAEAGFKLALEAAANGQVSGTLEEWPVLELAFKAHGFFLPRNTRALELTRISRKVLALERLRAV